MDLLFQVILFSGIMQRRHAGIGNVGFLIRHVKEQTKSSLFLTLITYIIAIIILIKPTIVVLLVVIIIMKKNNNVPH